jgi:hypothetical protein
METYEQSIDHNSEAREQAVMIMQSYDCEGFLDLDLIEFEGEFVQ